MKDPRSLYCREIDPTDDLAALTALLHAAYAPHAANGLRYWATHQSVEDTAARLGSGYGLVGTVDGRIVATITLRPPNPGAKVELFRDPHTWSFGQFAVSPEHKGLGYGRRLHDFAVTFAVARGCRRMVLDTAQPARALIDMYRRWGYMEIGTCDWRPDTNYVSVLMQKSLVAVASEIIGLDHVQLAMPAGQEAVARGFYAGVLGLAEETKPANLRARGGVWFRGGALRLHLGVESEFHAARKAHPAIHVRGLADFEARCSAAGFPPVADEPLEGFDRFYVFDPFGNRIELLERKQEDQKPPAG